jgi:chromosome segregation ATPase
MAMSMGRSMDGNVNKQLLITQAENYTSQITGVHNQNLNSGAAKKQELVKLKESENHTLNAELANLREQLNIITNQIQSKENQLSLIDNKYTPMIKEVDDKLVANDMAKDGIITEINKVKTGILNYIN